MRSGTVRIESAHTHLSQMQTVTVVKRQKAQNGHKQSIVKEATTDHHRASHLIHMIYNTSSEIPPFVTQEASLGV